MESSQSATPCADDLILGDALAVRVAGLRVKQIIVSRGPVRTLQQARVSGCSPLSRGTAVVLAMLEGSWVAKGYEQCRLGYPSWLNRTQTSSCLEVVQRPALAPRMIALVAVG